MPDELDTILRLVAEGKLTPEQAAPIIEALTRAGRPANDRPEAAEHADDERPLAGGGPAAP